LKKNSQRGMTLLELIIALLDPDCAV
jgi:type II secretory pathway pseudopilin PulG